MKTLEFTKVQWTWNDFVLIDNLDLKLDKLDLNQDLIVKMCDRNFGIGSDWVLIIEKSITAQYKYKMFNSDWTEAEMCGNWIRCFMKYLVYKSLAKPWEEIKVETMRAILTLKLEDGLVEVEMWAPILDNKNIPIANDKKEIESSDRSFKFTWVSMWNPHCVIFLDSDDDLETFDLEKYWKPIENNLDYFPNRINTEFVKLISPSEIKLRVWERGCWETLCCGTWVCASVVSWILNWSLEKWKFIKVWIKWWELFISWSWNREDTVKMKWKAEIVFQWVYNL